jgi:uncharacterized protein YqgC (DUF456 family)
MQLDSFMFTVLRTVFFVGMFSIAILILLPKAASFYLQWKNTGKSKYLSGAAACLAVAVFFLVANLVMFVIPFISRD